MEEIAPEIKEPTNLLEEELKDSENIEDEIDKESIEQDSDDGKRKRGRPFGTTKKEIIENLDMKYDSVCRESYVNIKETRRATRQLLARCLKGKKSDADISMMGAVLSKFLDTITNCDKLLIELAKLKKDEARNQMPDGISDIYESLDNDTTDKKE